jgi:hypothetical protein
MAWLGIDGERVREVGQQLAVQAAKSDDLLVRTTVASASVDLAVGGADVLDELGDRLRDLARSLLQAARSTEDHVLSVEAWPGLPLTASTQLASHNTYRSDRSVRELYQGGVRGFEFDLHGPTADGEWSVYHHAFDRTSNVATLDDALASIAALPTDEPLTVFLDFKDAPSTQRDRLAFDRSIRDVFEDRLFTPLDLIVRSPGAITLGAATAQTGWPTFAELSGSVLVVVTGDIDAYRASGGLTAAAFVAARPTSESFADPHIVIYNAPSTDLSAAEIIAIQQTGGLVRIWGRPAEASHYANYVALDLE